MIVDRVRAGGQSTIDIGSDLLRTVAASDLDSTALTDWPDRPLDDDAWAAFGRAVDAQRVWSLVAHAIERGRLPATDAQRADAIAKDELAVLGCLHLDRVLVQVCRTFRREGVEARLFKGAASALLAYPEPGQRTYSDVDLLVPGAQFSGAVAALEALGGRRQNPDPRSGFTASLGKSASFTMPGGWEVDLHRSPQGGPFGAAVRTEELFASSTLVPVGGDVIEALSLEHLFITACYHGVLPRDVRRLVPLLDVARMLAGGRFDEALVQETAARWQGSIVVAEAVQQATDLFGLGRTNDIQQWAAAYRPSRREQVWLRASRSREPRTALLVGLLNAEAFPSRLDGLRFLRAQVLHDQRGPAAVRLRRLVRRLTPTDRATRPMPAAAVDPTDQALPSGDAAPGSGARRVLIVSSELPPGPGGIGTHAHELARALHDRGEVVRVLGCQHYVDVHEAEAFNESSAVSIGRLPDGATPWQTAIARSRMLRHEVRRFGPDVVIGSGGRVLWLAAARCWADRVPWIAVVHGTELGGPVASARLTRFAIERADAVVAVSEFTRRRLVDVGVRGGDRALVITNGADSARFGVDLAAGDRFREQHGLGDRPVVLTVGNVSERKGQQAVVRALVHLVDRVPSVRYVVVGRGQEAASLRALAERLGVAEHLVMTGQVPAEDLRGAYNAGDVFAMTSVNTDAGDVEGFGIAVLEAALCATPSVVSSGTGAEETVVDGTTGIVCRADDPRDVADALVRLLDQPVERDRMGRLARERALASGTWAHRVDRYRDAIERVAGPAAGAGLPRMVVVSHTPHHRRDGVAVGFGPTVREIDHLATLCAELVHIAPLYDGPAPDSAIPSGAPNVTYVPVAATGGGTFAQRVRALSAVPSWARTIDRELARAEIAHVRLPAGIAMVALVVLALRRQPPKRWFKFAGNWQPAGDSSGAYWFQRWWLRHDLSRGEVTVNGRWPGQPAWVHTFENPTLTADEVEAGERAAREKSSPPPYRVAFVGRVEEAKGASIVIEAVHHLVGSGVDVVADLVGDGPIRGQLAQRSRELRIDDRVTFHGWLDRRGVESVLADAHVLLLPSRASEGFPKVLAEALAFGAVPVTSRVSGVGRFFDEIGLASSIDEPTAASVTSFLADLFADPRELERRRSIGLEHVDRFTYARHLDRVRSLLGLDARALRAAP